MMGLGGSTHVGKYGGGLVAIFNIATIKICIL